MKQWKDSPPRWIFLFIEYRFIFNVKIFLVLNAPRGSYKFLTNIQQGRDNPLEEFLLFQSGQNRKSAQPSSRLPA